VRALPEPVLRAARRWLEHLSNSGVARTRSLFTTHPDFADLTPSQYETAYTWLSENGLLTGNRPGAPVTELLFDAVVSGSGASWLPDADVMVRSPDELPIDALQTASILGLSPDAAYARVHGMWGKVDTAERARIGIAGELALIQLLTDFTKCQVDHVAARSDGYGYDISAVSSISIAHLEVKSTLRRGRLSIYLSRHEYETMRRDPCWRLIVVRLAAELTLDAVATVPASWIAEQIPADSGSFGRWESCRLDVPREELRPGIPALSPALVDSAPKILRGDIDW
jgi:hypothetical protein